MGTNNNSDALERIKAQFEAAGVSNLVGTKKEVEALPTILDADETVKYATSGSVSGNTVLAVLTQKRLLFIDKGLFYGIRSTEIPLDMINSVSYQKGLVLGKILVSHGSDKVSIENVQKETCSIMAEKVKTLSEQYKQSLRQIATPAGVSNVASSPSISDEIRSLKQLVDEGILTEEEFNAKKKQLLGI